MSDLGCSKVKIGSIPSRIIWIDWMKAIGMYFIVLGHVFTWGAEFVYTINVLSVIIVMIFIPIIMLAERYFPLILGKERKTCYGFNYRSNL